MEREGSEGNRNVFKVLFEVLLGGSPRPCPEGFSVHLGSDFLMRYRVCDQLFLETEALAAQGGTCEVGNGS